jgi:hypothetical protein
MHWPQAGSYSMSFHENWRKTHLTYPLKNIVEDGKIESPSEGYPELINVWKEMEKLLDTGACFVGTYDIRIV